MEISTSIRINAINDHVLLTHIPVCQTTASSYWCTMQQEGGVKNFFLLYHALSYVFLGFHCLCVLMCLKNLVLGLHALVSVNPSSLFILSGCNLISTASFTSWFMLSDVWLVHQSLGTRSSGLILCCVLPLQACLADAQMSFMSFAPLTCLSYINFSTTTTDPLRSSVLSQFSLILVRENSS